MNEYQIDLIKSYLNNKQIMLEYGVGGSTLYFSKYVDKYISIEHDRSWIDKIKTYDLNPNIELHLCPPDNNIILPIWKGRENDFKNYINYIDVLPYSYYDIVLLDGRARQFCAKKILNFIDNRSIVFVHDFFERNRYNRIYNYYNLIDKSSKNKPSLAVFRKK